MQSSYVDLNGINTWYGEAGSGSPLVMLHPGGVDSSAFGGNVDALSGSFKIYLPERRAHGHTPDVEGDLTFDDMADDTIAFLETVVKAPAPLIGYSDGASVALMVAHKRPDLVERLVFVAGVFHHREWLAEAKDPKIEVPQFMVDMYGAISPDGADHYSTVVSKLAKMHQEGPSLSTDDLGKIEIRTLVMMGDDDEVPLEHAVELYRSLQNGELAVVPGTSHGLLPEKPKLCNQILLDFLTKDASPTFAPIRRR